MSDGYKDQKEFTCVSCGKKIMATKFASQKTIQCPECKEAKAPINPDIVSQALSSNPPKERHKSDGETKILPCIHCGDMTEVSKFMSASKVVCDKCKGDNPSVGGVVQRIKVDMSKLDRSKILPIEEYEINDVMISNPRLRKVVCPACGHEYMKPLSVLDWSQFGLIISYQCHECMLTATVSEQSDRVMKIHSPAKRFDYTGHEILDLVTSSKDSARYINIIRKLIKQLENNNIPIEDDEIIPYKWNNHRPVEIGYEIPESDIIIKAVADSIKMITDGNSDDAIKTLNTILKGGN